MRFDVIADVDGTSVRSRRLEVDETATVRSLFHIIENSASEELGRKVSALLFVDGVPLSADDTPLSDLRATVVEAKLLRRPRLLSVAPLWGPEGGATSVTIFGEALASVVPAKGRRERGSGAVSRQRSGGRCRRERPVGPQTRKRRRRACLAQRRS